MFGAQSSNGGNSVLKSFVNMAMAFFNIRFSSSNVATFFCKAAISAAVITSFSDILISRNFLSHPKNVDFDMPYSLCIALRSIS